jgi:hypothetical protein
MTIDCGSDILIKNYGLYGFKWFLVCDKDNNSVGKFFESVVEKRKLFLKEVKRKDDNKRN